MIGRYQHGHGRVVPHPEEHAAARAQRIEELEQGLCRLTAEIEDRQRQRRQIVRALTTLRGPTRAD